MNPNHKIFGIIDAVYAGDRGTYNVRKSSVNPGDVHEYWLSVKPVHSNGTWVTVSRHDAFNDTDAPVLKMHVCDKHILLYTPNTPMERVTGRDIDVRDSLFADNTVKAAKVASMKFRKYPYVATMNTDTGLAYSSIPPRWDAERRLYIVPRSGMPTELAQKIVASSRNVVATDLTGTPVFMMNMVADTTCADYVLTVNSSRISLYHALVFMAPTFFMDE